MIKKLLLCFVLCLMTGCAKQEVKSEVYYEIFVGSFNDSNGDGIGDLNGVIQKLDYLKELGVSGIWLMPIMKSDSYHKYDITNYYEVDESYGSIDDFKNLVGEAKKRNIDVIIDLVLNHTSDKHPWFIDTKENILNNSCSDDNKCDYYNFSDTKESGYEYLGNNKYYEARFYSGMPDLNLDNENVRNEIKEIVNFWMDTGIKGFRLDAVLYYYQNNATKNNEFVSWLTKIVKEKNSDAFIVGEVWSSADMIINHYDSNIDSLFDFTMSGQDGLISKSIMNKSGKFLSKQIIEYNKKIKEHNQNGVNSLFLSNHDQSRSAGYYSLEKQKLAASVYLLSDGIPFIYYGEEIGLRGSGKDENKRLPMLWGESNDTKGPKDSDYTSQIDTSIKIQQQDKDSLLNHYKKIINLRKKYVANKKSEEYLIDNDNLFVLNYEGSIVIINFSDSDISIESSLKLLDKVDVLSTSKQKGTTLTIGGYGVVILRGE